MRKKTKRTARASALVILAAFFALSFVTLKEAWAFTDGYIITTETGTHDGTEINSLQFEVKQRKASGSASVKYETVNWYLFKKELKHETADINVWGAKYAFLVDTERVDRTEPDSAGIFYDTMQMDAEDFVAALDELYTREELLAGVTMYASRTLQMVNGSGTKLGGPYYNYTDFCEAANWSDGTLLAVEQSYNIPIHVELSNAEFNVRYVVTDLDGKETEASEPEGFVFAGAVSVNDPEETVGAEVLYGEKLSFGSVSYSGSGYTYDGYRWTSRSGSTVMKGSPAAITVNNAMAPNGILELTFYFTEQPEPTPVPFEPTKTPAPEPTRAPDATATPTPTPTNTPTPKPTSTPTPTPQPTEDTFYQSSYERYYSTDAGYYIGKIVSGANYLAGYNSVNGSGGTKDSSYTIRDLEYAVGTDAAGNSWYFIADGTNATYVHPEVYNGYAVESAEVAYITELIFPSVVTCDGTDYTVVSIGGGTDKYKTTFTDYKSNYNSYGNGSTTEWNYGTIYGEYDYIYTQSSSSAGTTTERQLNIRYSYGVLGNGEVTSEGCNYTIYDSTGAKTQKDYVNSYYVYNTTLKKVTIPSTVTEILPYAFSQCQALETIEGGDRVLKISRYGFRAEADPEALCSSTWTVGSTSCYEYFYYNGEYSMDSVTGVMSAWETASRLSSRLEFPYLPVLETLEYRAFDGHRNIAEVDLSATVSTIGSMAFSGCKLDNIRIPNASCSIVDALDTLGTKGYGANLTGIHTVSGSTALSYGLKYDGYYQLFCGYPVTYKPNGGTGEDITLYSALHVDYLETDGYLKYSCYKKNIDNWYTSDCRYVSYLDEAGGLWRLDTTNKTMAQVSAGTTFTELFGVGLREAGNSSNDNTYVAHYAWDSEGNLWFSGQRMYYYLNDSSEWDKSYSDTVYGWQMVTLPDNVVELEFTEHGIYCLDESGIIWSVNPEDGYTAKVNADGTPAFTTFAVADYEGSTEYGHDAVLFGPGTNGNLWRAYQGGNDDGFATGYGQYEEDYAKLYALKTVSSADIKEVCYLFIGSNSYYWTALTNSGDLYAGKNVSGNEIKSLTGYGFAEMEQLASDKLLLVDASGNGYLVCFDGKFYVFPLEQGTDVKKVWKYTEVYSRYSYAVNDSDYTETETFWYIWTDDGYVTVMTEDSSWKMADVRFCKVDINDANIFGLAEDGTLWNAGENSNGQRGNPGAGYDVDYDYPPYDSIAYMTKTGDRTYADMYLLGSYTLALGTDQTVYFAGNTAHYDGMADNGKINEFVRSETQAWPKVSRFIRGYDYDTEIAHNLFEKGGHNFTGWNTAADGSGTSYQPGDMVELSASLTLYAQWGEKNKVVSFRANGGSGYMPALTMKYSETSATLPENRFVRSGYTFVGWNTEADGTGTTYADKQTVTGITGNMVLYARWEKQEINYSLVYMKYPFGTVNNMVWKEVSLTFEQEETVEGAPYTTSGYTVTYSTNKTSDMSTTPATLDTTSANTQATAPSFDSWLLYKEVNSSVVYRGRSYIQGQTISKLTQTDGERFWLYPSWSGANASVILPEAACEGYSFMGWSETADGSGNVYTVGESDADGIFTPVKNTALYAVWTPINYTITLDGQSATIHTQTQVTMTFDAVGPNVTVPAKTNYIFMGYYTGTNGSGIQYFDKDGKGTAKWQISDGMVDTLYAYWILREVQPQEPVVTIIPTPLPEYSIEGSIGRTDAKGLLYADDYNSATDAISDLQPYLVYDVAAAEGAIPGTEKLSFRARMGAWLYHYKLYRHSGVDEVRYYVTVPYRIYGQSAEVQTATYLYVVPKTWSYWEVQKSGMYYPSQVTVRNEAIKGELIIPVNNHGDVWELPSCEVTAYGEKENHVMWEEYDSDGYPAFYITLKEVYLVLESPDQFSEAEEYLATLCLRAAWEDGRKPMVRNDKYLWKDEMILSDEWRKDGNGGEPQEDKLPSNQEEIALTSYLQTYRSEIELDETKLNGAYNTKAVITYCGDETNIGAELSKEVILEDINPLRIHTPVVCKGVLVSGTENGNQLVLKNSRNVFSLQISNEGEHRRSLGYGKRDFAFSLSGKSNVAIKNDVFLNQVKFPFGVYVDVGNNAHLEEGNFLDEDFYLQAGTWFSIGHTVQQFYVPITAKNGTYQLEFRTISVNCPQSTTGEYFAEGIEQKVANVDERNYVATDSMEIEIKSYLKDFKIVETSDIQALRELQAGCQAVTLKKGYSFTYKLFSQGEFFDDSVELSVTPYYFWQSAEGRERYEVKLYRVSDFLEEYRKDCFAWEDSFLMQQEHYDVIKQEFSGTGVIPEDVLCVVSDTMQGYCEKCGEIRYTYGENRECRNCKTLLDNWMSFSVEDYVKKQTITGREDFFMQNGFLIIHLEVKVKSNQGVWYEFTAWEETELAKDALAAGWDYVPGDVIRYNLLKSISDDYELGGIE